MSPPDDTVGAGRSARLYFGDCLESMRAMPAESVDAVVCDPPYGLSSYPDMVEVLRHWLAGDDYTHGGSGFMGKAWDSFVPGPPVWREALRVLKPGGYLLAFAGTRTQDIMGAAIRIAGFEIRDSLIWNYGSGFPKSLNVAIAIDKQAEAMGHRGKAITVAGYTPGAKTPKGAPAHDPITDDAKAWQGWGTALKPAFEPVVVARKPLTKGLTVAANVLKHGTGAINVDGCRVGTEDTRRTNGKTAIWADGGMNAEQGGSDKGRWPANLILTHAPGCVRVGLRKVKSVKVKLASEGQGIGGKNGIYSTRGARPAGVELGYADADGTENVAAYECAPGCPVAALDAQSGVLKSGNLTPDNMVGGSTQIGTFGIRNRRGEDGPSYGGDKGGASRFFTVTEYGDDDRLPGAEPGAPPFYYASKASRSEREAGCGGLPARSGAEAVDRDEGSAGAQSPRAGAGRTASEVRNHHPTVKPLSVMRWLCRLVIPPGGIVLDPFMGSGTTGVAALLEGFNFVGCEREADYLLIAEARIAHHAPGARLLGPSDE